MTLDLQYQKDLLLHSVFPFFSCRNSQLCVFSADILAPILHFICFSTHLAFSVDEAVRQIHTETLPYIVE